MRCDYCNEEIIDGDMAEKGLDYCCTDCMEDICDCCGDLISPSTSEAYMGRCIRCKEK